MPILNYTTKIDPHKTVSEIQRLLATKGASAVMIEYGPAGKVAAVLFVIPVNGASIRYRLPNNPEGIKNALFRQRVASSLQTIEQAERVGWRIVKDWIEAQLALVEAGQAQMAEVFLPYAMTPSGETAFAMFERQAKRWLLTDGGNDDDRAE